MKTYLFLVFIFFSIAYTQSDRRCPCILRSSIGTIDICIQGINYITGGQNTSIIFKASDGVGIKTIRFFNDVSNDDSINWHTDINYVIIKLPEFTDSVIIAVAGYEDGTDNNYEGTLIGIVNGKLEDLLQQHLKCGIQGSICIEGKRTSKTQLILWNELWAEDGFAEAHYGLHRYRATVFEWNGINFIQIKSFETEEKYKNYKEAASKNGYHSTYDYVANLLPDYR
jgi:hypothetical protein